MKTINQLNEKIKTLESHIATKDRTITALEQAKNFCSNATILSKELSTELSIVVPSSDEINHHRGKVIKLKKISIFSLRKNKSAKIKAAK